MADIKLPSTSVSAEVNTHLDCDFDSCEACDVTEMDFYALVHDGTLLQFFYKHGVIPCHHRCKKCGRILSASGKNVFRCHRIYSHKSKRKCKFFVSVFKNSFFSNASLSVTVIARLVYHYVTRPPPRVQYMQHELGVSRKTIIEYFTLIREVFVYWATQNSDSIGGAGKIVEINEAEIGKRNFHRGRYLDGQWVFGGIERGTKRFFLEAVDSPDSDTLLEIIRRKILPGTTVYSHSWRACESLGNENYRDLTVGHSLNFVDSLTGVHKQNSDGLWVEVCRKVPRSGRKKEHYTGYICECLFMMRFPDHRRRYHEFWKSAAALYPPLQH